MGLAFGAVGPAGANPFDANCDLSGSGSSADPFLLTSHADFIDMERCTIVGGITHFALKNNIFFGAGVGDYFRDAYFGDDKGNREDVVLDGKGFGIYGLVIGDPNGAENAIFSEVGNLTVKNLVIQTGSIVGGSETAVIVGDVDNLVVDNLTIINDGLICEYECGLVAGYVTDSLDIRNTTLVSRAFIGGEGSGLLVGRAELSDGRNFKVQNVAASAQVRFTSSEGSFGGLVGTVEGGSSVDIQNVFVALNSRSDLQRMPDGPDQMGGLIGRFDSGAFDTEIIIRGAHAKFNLEGAADFGGIIGEINQDSGVIDVDFDDIMVEGIVRYQDGPTVQGGKALSGGLIGKIWATNAADDEMNLNVDDALIELDHVTPPAYDDSNITISSIVQTDGTVQPIETFNSISLNDVVLNINLWGTNRTANATKTKNTETGITDLNYAEIDVLANLPFENIAANPGTLGTDDWELCDTTGGPFPTFTPNACGHPTISMSGSQVSAVIGSAVTAISDQAPKGQGHSLFYSVEPSLPSGLYLNPLTGEIGGTPVELRAAATYKIWKHSAYADPLAFNSNISSATSFFVAESLLPPAQVVERVVGVPLPPEPYAGPILTQFSSQSVPVGESSAITASGVRLKNITGITIDGLAVGFELQGDGIKLTLPPLTLGSKTMVINSTDGVLRHQGAITVIKPEPEPEPVVVPEQVVKGKVNAGSFKGFVAIYASGYEGKRLSAKVGKDWVIIPALESNFERIVEFTGAGVQLSVPIYIDRVLTETISLITR